jgi:hypothetical protein
VLRRRRLTIAIPAVAATAVTSDQAASPNPRTWARSATPPGHHRASVRPAPAPWQLSRQVLLILLTTADQTHEQVPSGILRAVIAVNPTEYVLQAMRDLVLTGFDWGAIGLAFAVIAGPAVIGLPLRIRN